MSTPFGSAYAASDRGDGQPDRIGAFRIVGILGRGGMGVVYDALGEHGEKVALKVIRPQGDSEHQALLIARFTREAKILSQLSHPGVVRMIDAGDAAGVLYLAMERIEGVSLLTIRRQGPLGYDPLLQLGIQLADTLAHMHQAGVVHRDIKPANILIDAAGRPIITDFGISGLSDATGITRMGDLLGSPGFMAPEVTEGDQPSALSDQFALGRLLYELGANGPAKRLPKHAPILEILNASLEIDWNRFPKMDRWPLMESVLRRMVSHHPEDRYPSASAAKAALMALTSSDLLDSDTLSEHLESLGLKPSTVWEVDVPQILGDEKQLDRASDDLLASQDLPASEGSDRQQHVFAEKTEIDSQLTSSFDLPRFMDTRSEDITQVPLGATAPSSPAFMPKILSLDPRRSDAIAPPGGANRERASSAGGPAGQPFRTEGDQQEVENAARGQDVRSRLPSKQPVDGLVQPAPSVGHPAAKDLIDSGGAGADGGSNPARKYGGAQDTRRESGLKEIAPHEIRSTALTLPVPGPVSSGAGSMGLPLHEITRKREQEPSEARTPSSSANEPVEAQIPRLERQIARLKEQLHAMRHEHAPSRRPLIRWALIVGTASLVSVAATLSLRIHRAPSEIVLVAPGSGEAARPLTSYKGSGALKTEEIRDALGLHESALAELKKKDLDAAEALLRECIELADLPECHRTLATMLALTRNPAARTHFEHYLTIAPSAPDAEQIRRILER
jgi:serine/threonine protein kinase